MAPIVANVLCTVASALLPPFRPVHSPNKKFIGCDYLTVMLQTLLKTKMIVATLTFPQPHFMGLFVQPATGKIAYLSDTLRQRLGTRRRFVVLLVIS